MKTVLLSATATVGLLASASGALAAETSRVHATVDLAAPYQVEANGRKGGAGIKPGKHMGGFKPGGHHVGFRPRPGFHGIPKHDVYRRPHRGFILPRYWVQPTFNLYNFRNYGLTAPSNGYYWSRYYDDAVLTDHRGYVQDYRSDIDWDAGYDAGPDRTDDYRHPDFGPAMRPDSGAYGLNEGEVAFAAPDGSRYSYDGEWQGEYVDPQGRVFEGDWSGTVTRHDGVEGPGYPATAHGSHGTPHAEPYYDDEYEVPNGFEGYERCLKSSGVKGAAIGAILGGVAGNRIAGRGDRVGGTLLGAGLGGLAGVAIEKAMDKCKRHHPGHREPRPYAHHGYPLAAPGGYGYHHGWQGGYYYYPQAPQVTVTVIPGATHTTTTVTEEVYYETVRSTPRKKIVRKWKPKPKPRCVCR